ncbi:hypothetical protein Tco_1344081 [Tanacetum coccineum]
MQQQSSSVSSNLVSKFMNLTPDTGIDSILNPNIQSNIPVNVSVSVTTTTPSCDTTISQTPVPIIQPQQKTHDSITTTTIPATTLPNIPNFASLFGFERMAKAQVSKILPKVEKFVTESLGAEVLARSSNQPQTSYVAEASLSEFELKKNLIEKINENKPMNISDIQKNLYNALIESYNSDKDLFASYGDVVTLKRGRDDQDKDEEPCTGSNRGTKQRRSGKEESSKEATQKESKSTSSSKGSQTLDREWNKTKTVDDRPPQSWMTQLAQASGTQSSFNEFLSTPIDFSAFIMNRLKLNNLTQDVLTGLTYDLMKGTCKSVVELEYHLEEVFKATNDQLDWHNPEGRLYPHDLSKPLPSIQNARGRQVIPFDHFINNDLEYLKGGSLSKKYTTSLTKTKAADYGHVKWIEDKVHRIILWICATKMETSKDVYLRHGIIIVTSLKIMELFGYKRLEEITVQRQDDQLYRFREDYFKRLRRQDIEDIVTSSSYKMTGQNSFDAYPDELHKFSDGTLNHVRTTLNDIATGIQMEYLPKRKWSKQDKQRAWVMINAIDKKLKDRRLMRSLEKFVGGRPYGGDLRLLQRTI